MDTNESSITVRKPVRVAEVITRIFAKASWKLILCESYDEKIIEVFFNYVRTHSAAQLKLRCCHPALHPIYCYFIPEIQELRGHLRQATAILSTAFAAARAQIETQTTSENSIIHWLLREVDPYRFHDNEYLTNILLAYGITFVFSPTPIGTQVIYEMAFRPDHCEEMRVEADHVLGAGTHSCDKTALRSLTKLDSFWKETHRHHPSAACKYAIDSASANSAHLSQQT